MVVFGQGHRLVVEQAGVGHLDGGLQPVLVGDGLLGLEDIQAFGQQGLASQILLLALAGDLFGVLRHHLWAVDQIEDEFRFHKYTPLYL